MIGLDFGTTNSCVAVRTGFGEIESVTVATGNRPPYDTVLRSAVLNPEGKRPVVGGAALQQAEAAGPDDRLLVSFKPFLDEHQLRRRERKAVGTEFHFDPLAEAELAVDQYESVWVGGEDRYTRGELVCGTAAVISHLLSAAVAAGGDVGEVWLGMPVSFSSCARQRLLAAMRETVDSTGAPFFETYRQVLESVRFVLEPVAVAAGPIMRDAHDAGDAETVLVFDHGGGTLDLSIIAFERHPDFPGLVPAREMGAAGSRDVAGRSLDKAFRGALEQRADFAGAAVEYRDYLVDQLVEECKIRLSTDPAFDALPGIEATRDEFEAAAAPVLAEIQRLVSGLLASSGLATGDIDRVVLTGGSSLVPCVQETVASLFPALDEYRMLTYDPGTNASAESAITEVARGLVAFADEVDSGRRMSHVVLWDVDALIGDTGGFTRIAERGDAFATDEYDRPVLTRRVDVPPNPGVGMSIGIYERELRHRYLFGLAEIPPLPAGGILEIELRPDDAKPALRLLDPQGTLVRRNSNELPKGVWPSECEVVADLRRLPEEAELAEYFEADAEYIPVRGFRRFECSPLVRPVRTGDLVEWARDTDGSGPGRTIHRWRGTVLEIFHLGDPVSEMQTLNLGEHRFRVRLEGGRGIADVEASCGELRLAARPGFDF